MRAGYYCDSARHLVCLPYSVEALHRMATELDIGHHWFHAGKNPHYDIPKRRVPEIMGKCDLVTSKVLVRIIKGEVRCDRRSSFDTGAVRVDRSGGDDDVHADESRTYRRRPYRRRVREF